MKRILLAEDETIIGHYLGRLLEQQGYHVTGYHATGEALLQAFAIHGADLIIADIHLAGRMSGIDAAGAIQNGSGAIPVLFITADTSQHPAIKYPFKVLTKPFSDRQFLDAVKGLLPPA